jgi:hypothetical protein
MHSDDQPQASFDWRAHLAVHPAAELFPPLSEAELRELAEDIRANGLRTSIVTCGGGELIDGRNRLDALALAGLLYATDGHLHLKTWTGTRWAELSGDKIDFQHVHGADPYAIALSFNVHRRHLTAEQKRELVAKLVTAKPELSDRQLGKLAASSKNTVAAVRTELEARGQIDHVEKREDSKGRKQPARKSKPVNPKKTAASPRDDAETSGEQMKARHAAAEAQVELPPRSAAVIALAADTPCEFDGHVLRLLQMINKARPGRFALRTGVSAADLRQLAGFLTEVASERPSGE